jgi:hypothetical protein
VLFLFTKKKKKKFQNEKSDQKFGRRGTALVTPKPGKREVPEHCSGLHPSEKQLPEWHSGTFHHKNTPDSTQYLL